MKILNANFEVRDLNQPSNCIRLRIKVDNGSLSISQPMYIANFIKKYGQTTAKTVKIPMQAKMILEKDPKIPREAEKIDKTKYQEIIGSLLHLSVFSRPDI